MSSKYQTFKSNDMPTVPLDSVESRIGYDTESVLGGDASGTSCYTEMSSLLTTPRTLSAVATPDPTLLGAESIRIVCPKCREKVDTAVDQEMTDFATCCCCFLGFTCLWCFVFIPLYASCCKEYRHHCPNCRFAFKTAKDKPNKVGQRGHKFPKFGL